MKIAESVSKYHPDKICDQISDMILDHCLKQDSESRVAMETAGGHGEIFLVGEVTTNAKIDYSRVAQRFYKDLTGKDIVVWENIVSQSPDIAGKVDTGGAGDQGLMIGYACSENEMYIPQEMYLARKLLEGIEADAKSQVVMDGQRVVNIVLSAQGHTQQELEERVKRIIPECEEMYCNNIGRFDIGGFDADSGVTGRKIVVDAYGGRVPVGGGAFSGKDPTKVDRSGAYMARWIALQYIALGAKEALVKLGYVIGKDQPLLKEAIVDGKTYTKNYDCRPQAIIDRFDLRRPIYKDTAQNGHFGRIGELPWERLS